MGHFKAERRRFLRSMVFTGAAASAGAIPGLSWSSGHRALRVRFYRDLDSLDSGFYVGGSPANDINWCIMPTLANYGPGTGWVPSPHVERIEVRDATHIDFTLKRGLQWSGGHGEVTTEDVAWTYARMAESEWKGDFAAFDRVDVKDSHSGTIVLSKPFAPFMNATVASGTGIVNCKRAVEAAGGKYTLDVPATCGPYVILEHRQGQGMKLGRNPEWKGTQPYYDTIEGIYVTEDEAAALAFEAGELDCTLITANAYARYLKAPPPGGKLTVAGALQYMWLGMNTEHPKLADIRVRKAIQRAIDQQAIIDGAYSGTAEPSYGVICPGLVGRRTAAGYPHDPAEAKALLDSAGVSGLSLTLRTLNNQERVLASQIIQANLAEIGISVEILPLDSGPFWEMGQESKGDTWKDLEIWLMRFGSGPDPFEPLQWFVREQVGIWNWERWSSDEFERIFEDIVAETDPARRASLGHRAQEIMEDTGAYVWLTHEPEVFVHRADIDTRFAPTGEMMMNYFTEA